jgi:hypothetical protein
MKAIKKILSYWKYGLVFSSPYLTYAAYKLDLKEPKLKKIPLDIHTANSRADKIRDLKYDLKLCLKESQNNKFYGRISIDFSLINKEDIFLDFEGKIVSLKINGNLQETFVRKHNRIYLNKTYLKSQNNIIIEFESIYQDTKSKGLIKMVILILF